MSKTLYPLIRKLRKSGHFEVQKNLLVLPGIETYFIGRPVRSLDIVPIMVSQTHNFVIAINLRIS